MEWTDRGFGEVWNRERSKQWQRAFEAEVLKVIDEYISRSQQRLEAVLEEMKLGANECHSRMELYLRPFGGKEGLLEDWCRLAGCLKVIVPGSSLKSFGELGDAPHSLAAVVAMSITTESTEADMTHNGGKNREDMACELVTQINLRVQQVALGLVQELPLGPQSNRLPDDWLSQVIDIAGGFGLIMDSLVRMRLFFGLVLETEALGVPEEFDKDVTAASKRVFETFVEALAAARTRV